MNYTQTYWCGCSHQSRATAGCHSVLDCSGPFHHVSVELMGQNNAQCLVWQLNDCSVNSRECTSMCSRRTVPLQRPALFSYWTTFYLQLAQHLNVWIYRARQNKISQSKNCDIYIMQEYIHKIFHIYLSQVSFILLN